MKRTTGRYESTAVAGEDVQAFVPHDLPVSAPSLQIEALRHRIQAAEAGLRRLDLAAEMVPSVDWFLYAFVRKEAVVSSQIEGTQATLVDLFQFESEHRDRNSDIEDICNYVDALRYAREQLHSKKGLPLSVRLFNEIHRKLMKGVRGANKAPGQVRRTQNWIGGSRPGNAAFVPPPPHRVPELLSALEKYVHIDDSLPAVARAGVVHVQFETIHPYLDGNGRMGRLLISLLLEHWKQLTQPMLYLSLFFKRHQAEYYRRLDAVRRDGDWEGWLDFFLDGVATISEEAVGAARKLYAIVNEDRQRLLALSSVSVASLRLFEALPKSPVVTVQSAIRTLGATKPTAGKAIDALVEAKILQESTGRQRGRAFNYGRYLDELRSGTDLGEVEKVQPVLRTESQGRLPRRKANTRASSKRPRQRH